MKRGEGEKKRLNEIEMRYLKNVSGATRMDGVRNKEVKRIAAIMDFDALAELNVLRWSGHGGENGKKGN